MATLAVLTLLIGCAQGEPSPLLFADDMHRLAVEAAGTDPRTSLARPDEVMPTGGLR